MRVVQVKGYRTVFKQLHVPVTTAVNINEKFKIDGTVANLILIYGKSGNSATTKDVSKFTVIKYSDD